MDVEKIKIAIDTGDLQRAKDMLDKVGNQAQKTDKAVTSLGGSFTSFKGVVATIATNAVITNLIKMSDTYSSIDSRLKLATSSTKEYVKAQESLFSISQKTRTGLEDTTEFYAKMQLSTKALKVSQDDLLQVTETINKTGIISGGSAESIKAALMQLGQAFGAGKLGGEELNSILEQTPRLARAVADGMNVEVGALKSLAEQGAITSKVLFDAIKSQSNVVDIEFNGMAQTIGQSYKQIENSTLKVVGTFLNASGTTSSLSQSISDLSKSIDGSTASLVDFSIQVGAVFGRTVDMINLGYETLENTGQKIVGGIARTVYGVINSITSLSYESAKSLNAVGIMSDEAFKNITSLAKTTQGAYDAAGRVMLESTSDLNNALQKANLTIEERVQISKAEYDLSVKTSETRRKELDSLDSKTKKTKEQIETEAKAKKELERASEKQQKDEVKRLDDITKAYQESAKIGMTDYEQKLYDIKLETIEFIKTTGDVTEALRLQDIAETKLNKSESEERIKKQNEELEKTLVAHRAIYDLKEKQLGLIDDDNVKNQELAKVYNQRQKEEYQAQYDMGKMEFSTYEQLMQYEDELLSKNLQRYSATGQIIESVSSGMKSTMMDFFDYTSDGFGDLKKMALDLGNTIYKAVTQQMVVNPLVGALSSAATSYFGGVGATVGSATASNNATLGISGADTNIQEGLNPKFLAKGGAYSSPSLSNYSNGVYSSPQVFAFAKGGTPNVGVFGEAGAEAIMPLTRDSNGSLGVKSVGGGNGVVKVEVINQTTGDIQVTNTKTRNDLEGTVLSIVINGINNNKMGLRTMIGKQY